MADYYLQLPGEGGGWQQFKEIGTHPISGEPVFAAVHALEPLSVGGGGGGVAGAVQIADAVNAARKLTVDASGAASVDAVDRAARLLGHVTIDNASLAVTGTFWQATQPVSLATAVDVSDRAARLVGHVTVDNASLAVTGTFWQATQPVSGPLTDTQLRAAAVPVSGTFWQATQPVSGTFFQATQPVSLAAAVDVSDRAARLLGHITVDNASLAVTQSGTWTVQPGNTQNTTPWLVKSSIDNSVQNVMVAWEEMAGTAAVESALTNATFRTENFIALGAANSYTVPAGKRLRITNISCYVKDTAAVNNLARLRLRAVASGAVLNTSPPVWDTMLAVAAPGTIAAGLLVQQAFAVPEGSLDFAAGAVLTFTWFTSANSCTVGLSFVGYLYTP